MEEGVEWAVKTVALSDVIFKAETQIFFKIENVKVYVQNNVRNMLTHL